MIERPILFSAPMVRALINGTKTQTRRVLKPQPYIDTMGNFCWNGMNFGQDSSGPHVQAIASPIPSSKTKRAHRPYGKPGDRLWVREAWKAHSIFDHLPPRDIPETHVWYMADAGYKAESRHRQSMHMPRWASRITLEITAVRVERLRDISESDAIAEGCAKNHNGYYWGGPHAVSGLKQMATATSAYRDLWESIKGHGSWDANPWVWVVEFKKIEKLVDS